MKSRIKLLKDGRDEGFTLIELLIVIIILGILAAIVVFAVGTTRKDAVSSSCKTDAKSIDLSAEAVNTKSGKYPAATGAQGGDNLLSGSTLGATNGALLKNWPGGTTANVATDDYVFTYAQTGGGTGYTLTVTGANVVGSAGTGGSVLTNNSTKSELAATCAGK